MTREEAISLLTQVKDIILGSESWLDTTRQPIEEAFNMAIEAIKSTHSNVPNVLSALDTISRQAAIDALEWKWAGKAAIDAIKNLPSAQPEGIYYFKLSDEDYEKIAEQLRKIPITELYDILEQMPTAQPELGKNSPSEQHKMDKLGVKTEETCTDIISRQAAINEIEERINVHSHGDNVALISELNRLEGYILHLPSAQPTHSNVPNVLSALDTISRQAAIDAVSCGCQEFRGIFARCEKNLTELPSAQPEQDEWCTDCKEYDSEKHCCPRFNRVIRKALKDAQPEIVRCAECKWFQYNMRFDGHLPKGVDEFECRHWCGSCDPTDFCSYAERKWEEDEDE